MKKEKEKKWTAWVRVIEGPQEGISSTFKDPARKKIIEKPMKDKNQEETAWTLERSIIIAILVNSRELDLSLILMTG